MWTGLENGVQERDRERKELTHMWMNKLHAQEDQGKGETDIFTFTKKRVLCLADLLCPADLLKGSGPPKC